MAYKPQILLTNDDGIESPGLWAAAEALASLGYVHVVAPREQSTAAGRSLPLSSDGTIQRRMLTVHGAEWEVFAVGGTPAQAVLHGLLEVVGAPVDLVVSGINYGENLGTGVTISGTIGAAMEAASVGIPAIAISLQTLQEYHLSYSRDVEFAVAGHFLQRFAGSVLKNRLPTDVDVLKIDIPATAALDTPWEITRQAHHRYYRPVRPVRASWDEPGAVGYELHVSPEDLPHDSDIYAVMVKQVVSVTPLSLDLTSRGPLEALDHFLRIGETA